MKKLKISVGIRGINNLPDRFNTQGFRDDIPILNRIRLIGETVIWDDVELDESAPVVRLWCAQYSRLQGVQQ